MELGHRQGRARDGSAPRPRRLRDRARDSRGIAIVEAAFVTPVFFVLVLGIIEIGLAMNDNLALASATRAGSRVASASGDDLYADYGVIQAIARESSALPRSSIKQIVIYKAAAFGDPPTSDCQRGISSGGVGAAKTGACNVYTAAAFSMQKTRFGCVTTENVDRYWCPTDRRVSLSGTGPDYVGVWMKVEHSWVTKMFGSTRTFTDSSVIQLEPRLKL